MSARVPHQAHGFARQDDAAAQSEDEIRIAIGDDQLHQLGVGEMTIPTQHELRTRFTKLYSP